MLALLAAVAAAQAPGPARKRPASPTAHSLAVLIVGDETSHAMRQKEEELIGLIRSSLKEEGLPKEVVPILVYHINKADERAYCAKKLGITKKQLLFVGLAEHRNLVVSKVILREPNVTDPQQAVVNLVRRAVAVVSGIPETTPTVHHTASPTETPTRTPQADANMRVAGAVACRSVDSRGAPINKTDVFDPEDTFYVSMEVYGLHVGTVIEARWFHGSEAVTTAHITSDKEGDYYAWFSVPPEKKRWAAGRYRVNILLNGRYQTSVPFRVSDQE